MITHSCSSCGALIVWCVTVNDKLQPVDAEPVDAGNIRIRTDLPFRPSKRGALPLCEVVQPAAASLFDPDPEAAELPLHMPHHATCPNADEWRYDKREEHP